MNGIADVGLVFQNALYLRDRPRISLFLGSVGVDVSECAVSPVIQISGGRHFFFDQNPRNLRGTGSVIGEIKDLLDDPLRFLVNRQLVLNLGMLDVTKRRVGSETFTVQKLRIIGGFDLFAGVYRVPFAEQNRCRSSSA